MVGPWGNGSKDLHNLVRTMAECRVAARARARGWPASDWELGEVMGQIRRDLSLDYMANVRGRGVSRASEIFTYSVFH